MDLLKILGKKPVIFGLGMAVGTGIGYLIFTLKKEKELDKIIAECNDVVDKANKQSEVAKKALDVAAVKAREGSDLALTIEEYEKLYSGEAVDYDKIHPDRAVEDPAELEHPAEDDVEEAPEETESVTENDAGVVDPKEEEVKEAAFYAAERRKPKFITEDVFEYDGRDIYDKCDLYYYVYDDILATEDEEIIDDVERTVGNCLDKFGFKSNDEGEIYVRNFSTTTDYRITKMFAEFGENRV